MRVYDWDYVHNDIEIYDRFGNHIGSMDPQTGLRYKGPVVGRTINW
jgi:filamentous hemagglutinin